MSQVDQSSIDAPSLRKKYYNAVVTRREDIHDDLIRIEIQPDIWPPSIDAGQYVTLGLGRWEPRVANCAAETFAAEKRGQMIRRAYSISCQMFSRSGLRQSPDNEAIDRFGDQMQSIDPLQRFGRLQTIDQGPTLEFYIVLVRQPSEVGGKTPELTPRLFKLGVGDRLEIGKKVVGHYTLDGVEDDDTVWMIGTGTGEAPHNAMATKLLQRGHRGDIIHVTTVRSSVDLGYMAEHAELMRRYPQYKFRALTTRDPINLDPDHPGYAGKRYIQDAYTSGWLADEVGNPLAAESTHVFLCGNPAMIGYTPPGAPALPSPGMLQILTAAGFHQFDGAEDADRGLGAIRFEKYW